MYKKLTTQSLVEDFAANNKIPLTVADEFVHAFFATISETLAAGESVKIKGWGTFKVSTMNDRESTDVNTGERIVIKGYNKVTFTPENALKDIINRPFSQFEAVELNDDYDIRNEQTEDDADEEEADDNNSPAELEEKEKPAVPSESDNLQSDRSQVPPSTTSDAEDSLRGKASSLTDEDKTESEAPEKQPPTSPKALKEEFLRDNPPEMVTYGKPKKTWRFWLPILLLLLIAAGVYTYTLWNGKPAHPAKFKIKEADMIKVESVKFDDEAENVAKERTEPTADLTNQTESSPESAPSLSDNDPQQKATETADEATANMQGEKKILSSEKKFLENKSENVDNKSAAEKNPGKPYKLALTPADAAKNLKDFTVADTTNYAISGTLAVHELQEGETIIRLAQMYYGDKKLWPYIVKYNWMKDPNHVSKGTVLNIPFLKQKE